MDRVYLIFDVGGTEIKAGILNERGAVLGKICHFPSGAREKKEAILDHFTMIAEKMAAPYKWNTIEGIGMAFPGPFDYEEGISLMKGLDKYDSIYGIPLEKEIKRRQKSLRGIRFRFLHDAKAFALGESWFGKGRDAKRLLCICIGTGTGSAFIENKKVIKSEMTGVPANGWIYDTPYKTSVIDDYLSVRGLARISREIIGEELCGRELYERCMGKDEAALLVYRRFGGELCGCVLPFLESFCPDCVVFGGQITGSFPYFGQAFRAECKKRNIVIHLEPDTSVRVAQGLFAAIRREEYAKS